MNLLLPGTCLHCPARSLPAGFVPHSDHGPCVSMSAIDPADCKSPVASATTCVQRLTFPCHRWHFARRVWCPWACIAATPSEKDARAMVATMPIARAITRSDITAIAGETCLQTDHRTTGREPGSSGCMDGRLGRHDQHHGRAHAVARKKARAKAPRRRPPRGT